MLIFAGVEMSATGRLCRLAGCYGMQQVFHCDFHQQIVVNNVLQHERQRRRLFVCLFVRFFLKFKTLPLNEDD